jgi:hypothetical protein
MADPKVPSVVSVSTRLIGWKHCLTEWPSDSRAAWTIRNARDIGGCGMTSPSSIKIPKHKGAERSSQVAVSVRQLMGNMLESYFHGSVVSRASNINRMSSNEWLIMPTTECMIGWPGDCSLLASHARVDIEAAIRTLSTASLYEIRPWDGLRLQSPLKAAGTVVEPPNM